MNEITWNDGDDIFIGQYQLDPNVYKDVEMYKNVTVIISENIDTHEMVVSWKRQPDTEDISYMLDEE